MKKNMGKTDRILRIVAAVIVVLLYVQGLITGAWAIGLLLLAGIFVLTSFISFCPLYVPFGMSTCSRK